MVSPAKREASPVTYRIADLFCGAGGAAKGLHDAGFEVVGFDIKEQPRYPYEFHQADALEVDLSDFDAVWASPPCQGYSIMNNLPWLKDREYPLLILPTRQKLIASGLPYIIENVEGAKFGAKGLKKRGIEEHGMQAGWLCGGMFSLPFYRHRMFESSFFWMQPGHPKHTFKQGMPGAPKPLGAWEQAFEGESKQKDNFIKNHHLPDFRQVSSLASRQGSLAQAYGVGIGHAAGWRLAAEKMGIDWMKRAELTQAVPPVYSKYLGEHLMQYLRRLAP